MVLLLLPVALFGDAVEITVDVEFVGELSSLLLPQLLGEVGGEVEVGEAEAELELATELQLPVFLERSVGSFSLMPAAA